jgi:hypothetical protein
MSLRQANFWHFPSQDYQSHPAHPDKNIPEKAGIAELLKIRKTRYPCALVAVSKKISNTTQAKGCDKSD